MGSVEHMYDWQAWRDKLVKLALGPKKEKATLEDLKCNTMHHFC